MSVNSTPLAIAPYFPPRESLEVLNSEVKREQKQEECEESHPVSVNDLPPELIFEIFSYLSLAELGSCLLVSKKWGVLASDEALWKPRLFPAVAFGKRWWAATFGDVGDEPTLPRNIHKILNSPCPFWPDKTIEETHALVLIPEAVDGEPLTLNSLEGLVKCPKVGHATGYKYLFCGDVDERELGNQSTPKSHWAFMTKQLLPESRGKSYADQQALIAKWAQKTHTAYEIPSVLDATVIFFMKYVESKERLLGERSYSYTRCQEMASNNQTVVGHASFDGLCVVGVSSQDDENFGIAALRKL